MAGIYHINKIFFDNPLNFGCINLLQIGRLYCNSGTIIPSHLHTDLYELTIVTDGKGVIITNGVKTNVRRGDIYFSHPFDSHIIESDTEVPLKFDFFAFTCNNENFKKEIEFITEQFHDPNYRVFRDDNIRYIIGNAIAEICNENLYSDDLLKALFEQILIYLIRGFKRIAPENQSNNATDYEILSYRMMNYIDTHIYSIKNLDELSEVIGYSYSYLSALFKKTTGNTLSEYYIKKKLDVAQLLVLENRLKITEIAEKLNYSSVYSFSKAFSRRYAKSPRNYYLEYSKKERKNEIRIF